MPDFPTLMDVARRSGDAGARAMVEILNQTNRALDDIPWIECNSGVTHVTTLRTKLPKPRYRMLNSGVPIDKSGSRQIKAGCGMLEVYAEVDKMQVDLAKGRADAAPDFMATENAAFIEGFAQEVSESMFYATPSEPQKPVGFTYYYNQLPPEGLAPNTDARNNVIDGGGTGNDNTSIWLMGWGENSLHGIYPQGSKAGLSEKFLGEVTLQDEDGGQYQGYRTHYKWDHGFVLRDWRWASRVCNLDVAALMGDTSAAANLIRLMISATWKLPDNGAVRRAFYMRRELLEVLDAQTMKVDKLHLSYQDVYGQRVLTFRGIPIREQASISLAEERVVA